MPVATSPSPSPSPHVYEGSCHCTATHFSIKLPETLEDTEVSTCSCSICSKHSYLLVYLKRGDVVFHRGLDGLSEYRFGTKELGHKFCATCGSSIMVEMGDGEGHRRGMLGVNVRLLNDADTFIDKLNIVPSSASTAVDPPHHEGSNRSSDAGSTYAGSCHCKSTRYTVRFPQPLEESFVCLCSCSICTKQGYLLAYPQKTDVVFEASDRLQRYEFASKQRPHYWCRDCGSSLYVDLEKEDDDVRRGTLGLNLRHLDNFDLASLDHNIVRWDGANMLGERFQVPVAGLDGW